LLWQQQNVPIILSVFDTVTPTHQITADRPFACFVPRLLKGWRFDAHPLQSLVAQVDTVDVAVTAVSTKPIRHPNQITAI
jgi:hypothetical protein